MTAGNLKKISNYFLIIFISSWSLFSSSTICNNLLNSKSFAKKIHDHVEGQVKINRTLFDENPTVLKKNHPTAVEVKDARTRYTALSFIFDNLRNDISREFKTVFLGFVFIFNNKFIFATKDTSATEDVNTGDIITLFKSAINDYDGVFNYNKIAEVINLMSTSANQLIGLLANSKTLFRLSIEYSRENLATLEKHKKHLDPTKNHTLEKHRFSESLDSMTRRIFFLKSRYLENIEKVLSEMLTAQRITEAKKALSKKEFLKLEAELELLEQAARDLKEAFNKIDASYFDAQTPPEAKQQPSIGRASVIEKTPEEVITNLNQIAARNTEDTTRARHLTERLYGLTMLIGGTSNVFFKGKKITQDIGPIERVSFNNTEIPSEFRLPFFPNHQTSTELAKLSKDGYISILIKTKKTTKEAINALLLTNDFDLATHPDKPGISPLIHNNYLKKEAEAFEMWVKFAQARATLLAFTLSTKRTILEYKLSTHLDNSPLVVQARKTLKGKSLQEFNHELQELKTSLAELENLSNQN